MSSTKARASTSSASTSAAIRARATTSSAASSTSPKATPSTACWSTAPSAGCSSLGYFTNVNITTEPGSADDRVIVVVNVVEQPTGEFSFGVGYSTSDGAVGDVSLTERNFLGRGYNLRVAVGGGTSTQSYEFGFTDPYFLGRRISAGVNVYRRVYDANSFRSYDYETTGGALTFGFPITEDFTVQTGYQIELQEISVAATRLRHA